jgi:ABC-type nitrate/sulfonate/bicarbonate transport system substrate-binding protein
MIAMMSKSKPWWLLSWSFFVLAWLGTSHGGQAGGVREKVTIGYASATARIAPLWIAGHLGFFSKYGLETDLVFVRANPTLIAALTSGDIQIGYTGGTPVLGAAVGGSDLKILATFNNRVTYDLVVRPGIKRPDELRGKRFGVQSIGGTIWMGTILGLERLGLDPVRDNIHLMVVGDQSVMAQSLVSGHIDASVLDRVFSLKLREMGYPILAELAKENISILGLAMIARETFIQQRAAQAEGVLKSLLEAHAFISAPGNKATTLKVIQKHMRVREEDAEQGYQELLRSLETRPFTSMEGLRNVQRLMKIQNPKVEKLKLEALVHDELLRRIEQSGFLDQILSRYGVR